MNFLVDAQLPRRMTGWLAAAGCDAIHTLDMPDGTHSFLELGSTGLVVRG